MVISSSIAGSSLTRERRFPVGQGQERGFDGTDTSAEDLVSVVDPIPVRPVRVLAGEKENLFYPLSQFAVLFCQYSVNTVCSPIVIIP